MVHYMESLEDGTAHGNIDGLFDLISLRQWDWTLLGSSVGATFGLSKVYKYGNFHSGIGGKLKMSVIWVL